MLAAGATGLVQVALSAQAGALEPGTYFDALVFSNRVSGGTISRGVSLTVEAIPGEIGVSDSIAPDSDLSLPFGPVIVGLSRGESITVTNSDAAHNLILQNISVQGSAAALPSASELRIAWPATLESVADGTGVVPEGARVPARPAAEVVIPAGYAVSQAGGLRVLVMSTLSDPASLREGLAAFPDVAAADFFDGYAGTPTVDFLSGYDVVLVLSDYGWWDADGTGDALADYVDAGGCVIEGVASFATGGSWQLGGRFLSEGYGPFVPGPALFAEYSLGAFNAAHPIMQGVTDLYGSLIAAVSLAEGADSVASWDNGTPLVAVREPSVAGINIFFSDGYFSEAAILLCHNAIVYLSKARCYGLPDLPGLPYTVPPRGSVTFGVVYRPVSTGAQEAAVLIESNDQDEPQVRVALSGEGIPDYLSVLPETGLSGSGHPGGPFAPASQVYTVSNNSAVGISWAAASHPSWVTVSPASGALAVGASASVTVSYNAAAAALDEGSYEGALVFSNVMTTASQSRPLALEVFTTPVVRVAPTSLTFTNLLGQALQKQLQIGNAAWGDANLDFSLGASEVSRSVLSASAAPAVEHDFTQLAKDAKYREGEMLVRFADTVAQAGAAQVQVLANAGGGTVKRRFSLVPGLAVVQLPEGAAMAAALVRFNQTAGILYAQPNYQQHAFRTPSDPYFSDLWGMDNTDNVDIDAPEAWEAGVGGPAVTVAVIDTGVDYKHEDLAANMWRNPGEIPGNGIDDDGNGYVDDVYGYDFCNGDADPLDDHDHGTHCAGTIGAVGDNGIGVAGVCWNVRIMALKFLDADGYGSTADAIGCIEYAVQQGARVLSNSWGGGEYEQALKDAIDAAGAAGVLFVAAAGNEYGNNNDTYPAYPASYESDNILSVMSVDEYGSMSYFSNFGATSVDLGAPGSDILSCKRGGGYQYMSGTSMATPHVSGACALLLSLNSGATYQQVKSALLGTTDASLPGLCLSGGLMKLGAAVAYTPAWLRASPVEGTGVVPGAWSNITVTADAGTLSAGTYEGLISVRCNDRDTPVTNVPVTMVILDDSLSVQPAEGLLAEGFTGGPFSPASKVYTLTNASGSSLSWSAFAAEAPWASVSPADGVLAAGQAAQVTVGFNAQAAALPFGGYSGRVVFSNSTSMAVQSFELRLSVFERVFDHFEWDWIAPTQYVGVPFGVTVRAIDNGGAVFPGFAGTAKLSAVRAEEVNKDVPASGTDVWNFPMSTYYHDARTQVIYLKEELGAAGTLNGLSLYVSGVPGQTMKIGRASCRERV